MRRPFAAALFTALFAALLPAPPAAAQQASGDDTPAYRGTPGVNNGACCRTLGEVRSNIDRIDREIVRLMAERGQYVREASRFKRDPATVEVPARAEAVVRHAETLAAADGLPPQIAEATYRAMLHAFTEYERGVVAGQQ